MSCPSTRSTAWRVLRILTDRCTEFCGNPERHEYELYLAVEDIDRTWTKARSPRTNGICERFHRTMLDEFYRVQFREKTYGSLAVLQADLDAFLGSLDLAEKELQAA